MRVVDIPILTCFRCAYVWRPSQAVVRICPRCKSARWDTPRIRRALAPRSGLGVEEVVGSSRKEVLRLARKHRARNIRDFGSVGRGQVTPDSDLDLLVRFDEGTDLFDRLRLERELGRLPERRVDVVTELGLHPLVESQVPYEAVPL